jgi:predicted DNA-binding transcriptional regulator AlpA
MKKTTHIQPRYIRLRDIPQYLGINVHYFNRHIRPDIPYIRYGKQSICFDRFDLDQWMMNNKRRNGMSRISIKETSYG